MGKRVTLSGLHAKPELNGCVGFAGSFDDARGRYVVSLEDGGGSFKIRPDNLAVAPPRVETDGASNISGMQLISKTTRKENNSSKDDFVDKILDPGS